MFDELVRNLTVQQKKALRALGVDPSTISKWKDRERLPTRLQAALLADVTGCDRHQLDAELTLLEALRSEVASKNPGVLKVIQDILGKATAVGAAVMSTGLVAATLGLSIAPRHAMAGAGEAPVDISLTVRGGIYIGAVAKRLGAGVLARIRAVARFLGVLG